MARRVCCALTACAVLAIGQHATAQTLGQAAAAARQAPAIDPALRADIEKLMLVTGSANLGAQMATQISDAFLDSFKQTTQNVVPPRVIEIVREVLTADFEKCFNGSFYETDLGRKAVANMPSLMREGGEIGQRWAQAAMPKMLQTLETRLRAEGLIP